MRIGITKKLPPRLNRRIVPVWLLFFISGFAGLVYQVCWQRVLANLLGSDAASVAAVTAVFLSGLGIGALAGGALTTRFPRRSLALFALLEGGVGLYGAVSVPLMRALAARGIPTDPAVLLFSLGLLLPPTLAMGTSLPLLAQHASAGMGRPETRVADLYLVNTLGGSAACFASVLLLFPLLGLSGTVRFAAAGSGLVALGALFLSRRGA